MKRAVLAVVAGLILTGCGQAPSQGQASTSDVAAASAENAVYQTYSCKKYMEMFSCDKISVSGVLVACQIDFSKTGAIIGSRCGLSGAPDLTSVAYNYTTGSVEMSTQCHDGPLYSGIYFTYEQDCVDSQGLPVK